MYTFNTHTGNTTRDSDGAIVAPVADANDPLFLEYNAWANSGNIPTIYAPTEDVESYVIKAWEFRDRFTEQELIAINRLAYAGDGDDIAILLLQKVNTATDGINLLSEATINGVNYLAFKGCIVPGRTSEILAV